MGFGVAGFCVAGLCVAGLCVVGLGVVVVVVLVVGGTLMVVGCGRMTGCTTLFLLDVI